ncbi:uncharacterized protein MELLADRAFT_68347 [Melampsora larici-populina 98AG31]|uniref:Uncharacterized protein n=1 Tax=Melampsora larici-populina (strain 98AG31 / pathotype 3-4-7) TaxID=747676 RepID=F4S6H0_MELLP|nr:uncharacterized protein MELLADRAFT_68347 [Melampsora larici-populina 98AG31]EGF99689.1 hypothetical protein MELLADRAFT_68347 [Melampsora larici-populina 98AG31]
MEVKIYKSPSDSTEEGYDSCFVEFDDSLVEDSEASFSPSSSPNTKILSSDGHHQQVEDLKQSIKVLERDPETLIAQVIGLKHSSKLLKQEMIKQIRDYIREHSAYFRAAKTTVISQLKKQEEILSCLTENHQMEGDGLDVLLKDVGKPSLEKSSTLTK